MNGIDDILQRQRCFFAGDFAPRTVAGRLDSLKRLKAAILAHTAEIEDALWKDLRKSPYETYVTEVGMAIEEIDGCLKRLGRWAKPERVASPVMLFPSRSRIVREPYGLVLIIAPWNYPFQLLMTPLISAVAAGNVVAVKPSEYAAHTAKVVGTVIREAFDERHVSVFEGGADVSTALLKQRFDYIFFTGSARVGRIVMAAAATHLTPVTLELGGKSPCIVDASAHIAVAAQRIVWGKLLNAGQTCVAPDYLLVHTSVKTALIEEMIRCIRLFYGEEARLSPDYPRLVSTATADRLASLLEGATILYGGTVDREERYIEPTLLDVASLDCPLMREEIFGPLLPVCGISSVDEAVAYINSRPKPLALYYFGDTKRGRDVIRRTSSGGACINDTVLHIVNPALPFGGVGESGMGSYHGRAGFETFSHRRSVLVSATWIDIKLKYPPYRNKLKWMKRLW
ncbi:MAG: aldehyde dehydrogenase [Tannerellaceae bacterium]|jgi:aldehyde dehydrogenase (NAD+)|nr:aldehyde dehydrogenase [Tannerellaceae bacterium]